MSDDIFDISNKSLIETHSFAEPEKKNERLKRECRFCGSKKLKLVEKQKISYWWLLIYLCLDCNRTTYIESGKLIPVKDDELQNWR